MGQISVGQGQRTADGGRRYQQVIWGDRWWEGAEFIGALPTWRSHPTTVSPEVTVAVLPRYLPTVISPHLPPSPAPGPARHGPPTGWLPTTHRATAACTGPLTHPLPITGQHEAQHCHTLNRERNLSWTRPCVYDSVCLPLSWLLLHGCPLLCW